MAEFRITENNHTFYGYEFGDRNLPTLVCLHGMTGDSNSFLGLKNFLTKDFHLILLDLPGHGNTEVLSTDEEYTFSSVAQRIDKVINTKVKTPFYIMGHSWGADLALNYTKLFPDKVIGVILIDGGYLFPEQVDGMTEEKALIDWEEYIKSSKYNSWNEVVKTYQEYTTKEWDNNLDSIIHSNFKKIGEKYVLRADCLSLLATIKAFFQEPCSTTYESIKCPVLLFHATIPETDLSRNKGIQQIQKKINDLKIVGIANTKHNVHWDNPKAVTEELLLWKKTKGSVLST
ncbi:alpha/beta fold hydrolase [Litchfieldia alkalitelluris]|uniref:alpha/beta fold hydrolase n=1 Tax=Litchfieldia alkalitelluris TaxID=304268 RepID=UPI000997B314|nr:alpha/beta fold hydrolase [Litchfieldia alkalitelluris]